MLDQPGVHFSKTVIPVAVQVQPAGIHLEAQLHQGPGNVAALLGLENAWTAPTEFSFAAPTPLERLAARPEARILSVGPIPPGAAPGLRRSVLWNRLTPVAEDRFEVLPPVNPFGAVPAALRFARLATEALERMA